MRSARPARAAAAGGAGRRSAAARPARAAAHARSAGGRTLTAAGLRPFNRRARARRRPAPHPRNRIRAASQAPYEGQGVPMGRPRTVVRQYVFPSGPTTRKWHGWLNQVP